MSAQSVEIQAANETHIASMQRIEVDAGRIFAEAGLHDIADADPPSHEELQLAITSDTCWVILHSGNVAGYAVVETVDGQGHLHQVSVARHLQGQGLGRRLVEHACAWAAEQGFQSITLTTFADLSWNGPLYARLGFAEITPAPESELAQIRQTERDAGLDVQRRIAMQRALS